mmetsp:Transcript_53056/g.147181  ORF Transcript_53056/g.147181 Transcript_53056/m.147181 type:complete len:239 (+) Transcript_53056:30-746(+)
MVGGLREQKNCALSPTAAGHAPCANAGPSQIDVGHRSPLVARLVYEPALRHHHTRDDRGEACHLKGRIHQRPAHRLARLRLEARGGVLVREHREVAREDREDAHDDDDEDVAPREEAREGDVAKEDEHEADTRPRDLDDLLLILAEPRPGTPCERPADQVGEEAGEVEDDLDVGLPRGLHVGEERGGEDRGPDVEEDCHAAWPDDLRHVGLVLHHHRPFALRHRRPRAAILEHAIRRR